MSCQFRNEIREAKTNFLCRDGKCCVWCNYVCLLGFSCAFFRFPPLRIMAQQKITGEVNGMIRLKDIGSHLPKGLRILEIEECLIRLWWMRHPCQQEFPSGMQGNIRQIGPIIIGFYLLHAREVSAMVFFLLIMRATLSAGYLTHLVIKYCMVKMIFWAQCWRRILCWLMRGLPCQLMQCVIEYGK